MAYRTDPVDLCIATTTPSEYEGAEGVLKKIAPPLQEGLYECDGTVLTVLYANWADFPGSPGSPGRPLRVALVGADGPGREEAVKLQEKISQSKLTPSVVAMTGVCAGNPSSVLLGDVLVPFEIALEAGKTEKGERKVQAKRSKLDPILRSAAQSVYRRERKWLDYIPEELMAIPSSLDVLNFILEKVLPYELLVLEDFM